MENNKELVSYLINRWVLTTGSIIEAFKTVDRRDFILDISSLYAYSDIPLSIWYDQTISQPYTVTFMLELLWVNEWDKILDVWSWSGWTTVLLADIVWEEGNVLWLELIPELVDFWNNNLHKYNYPWADIISSDENFNFIEDKFDKILVSASSWCWIPKQLLKKINLMWVMIIPVGDSILKVTKLSDDKLDIERFKWFSFVPLICNE